MSDLVARLRKYDAYMEEARERMATAIRREFPNGENAADEAIVTRSIHREAADHIERLQGALRDMASKQPLDMPDMNDEYLVDGVGVIWCRETGRNVTAALREWKVKP